MTARSRPPLAHSTRRSVECGQGGVARREWMGAVGRVAATLLGCAILGVGCADSLLHSPRPGAGAHGPPPLGFSAEGRAIRCRAYGYGPQAVLIVGGIHGSEPASAVLAHALCDYLDAHPAAARDRQVVVAPAVNPDGLARNRRTNAHGVDLNRNFATPNWGRGPRSGREPMSEPETRFIAGLIRRYEPGAIVQIHQPLACIDWDGPAGELGEAMARTCELPVKKLGARPGSLGSYAGVERRIPTITLELPGSASLLRPETLWSRYGEALLVAIRFPSARAGDGQFPDVKVGGEMRLRWERHSR